MCVCVCVCVCVLLSFVYKRSVICAPETLISLYKFTRTNLIMIRILSFRIACHSFGFDATTSNSPAWFAYHLGFPPFSFLPSRYQSWLAYQYVFFFFFTICTGHWFVLLCVAGEQNSGVSVAASAVTIVLSAFFCTLFSLPWFRWRHPHCWLTTIRYTSFAQGLWDGLVSFLCVCVLRLA